MKVKLEEKFHLLYWQTRDTDVSLLMLMFTHCYLGVISVNHVTQVKVICHVQQHFWRLLKCVSLLSFG